MSEKLLESPPQHELIEAHSTPDKPQRAERLDSVRNEKHEDNPSDRLNEIRSSLEELATSSEKTKQAALASEAQPAEKPRVTNEHKAESLQKELAIVRKQLPKADRALSQVVHNKNVQKVSTVGEKTIARPQALLWGGLFAALSSGGLYLTAKYIGFEYNYFVSILCFVAGYALGLIVELAVRLMRGSPKAA
jgi:hypothetical protein